MALKRGLDQMSAWLVAVVSAGAVFGAGYGISKVMARHHVDAEDASLEGEHEEHGGGEEHGKAEHEEHGKEEHAKSEHEEHGKSEHEEHGKSEHEEHGKEEHAKPEHEEHAKPEHEEHGEAHKEGHESASEEHPHTGGAAPAKEPHRHVELTPWSYGGSEGPQHWASLSDDYKTCETGRHQSPIDLVDFAQDRHLLPLRFEYHPTPLTFRSDRRLVVADLKRGSELQYDARHYRLVRIDFHAPSEHHVEGRPYDLEAELVHEDPEGRLLVLSLFYEQGEFTAKNKALAELWEHVPKAGDPETEPMTFDPSKLLPPQRTYYTYEGSLTQPPCTEGVRWILMREPLQVTEHQLDVYAAAIDRSNGKPVRPIQKLSGRRVLRFSR